METACNFSEGRRVLRVRARNPCARRKQIEAKRAVRPWCALTVTWGVFLLAPVRSPSKPRTNGSSRVRVAAAHDRIMQEFGEQAHSSSDN